MMKQFLILVICPVVFSAGVGRDASASDWPMWRYDVQRSGASPQELAPELHLQWVRQQGPLKPAWPDQAKLVFDHVYEPVVVGQTMFVGSSRDDTMTAIDTRSGKVIWVFYADGPVRLAPVVWKEGVLFASDDGYLYCVDASSGALRWKFRGGPGNRRIIGNERLISTWPARGGPVVADGTVYFAASIWPFMGVFIHALDAETGEVIWTNDGDGAMFIKQPHNSNSFAGVAPQGAMAVAGDRLIVPGGRSVPACYDRKTGKMLYYHLAANGKRGGGSAVIATEKYFFNGGVAFELSEGAALGAVPHVMVSSGDTIFACSPPGYREIEADVREVESTDRRGKKIVEKRWSLKDKWSVEAPGGTGLIRAGSRLYGGGKGEICAIDLPGDGGAGKISWRTNIDGTPVRFVAADDRLFVVTGEGVIYCFGAEPVDTVARHSAPALPKPVSDALAKRIVDLTGTREGYCVAWGVGTESLISSLLHQSDMRIIAIEPDAERALALRRRLAENGMVRERAAVHVGELINFKLPPYLASLVVADAARTTEIVKHPADVEKVFETLRPYGGTACFQISAEQISTFKETVASAGLTNARIDVSEDFVLLVREGALPGSANWTHEHADAANTRVSKDELVRAPLGLLWFGGSSHEGILPRHGHGPQPQVVDGHLLIEGMDMLRAMDVYTGRVIWEAPLPGVGDFYNNTSHEPGANATGTNFISMSDGIYVAYGKSCVRLNPETGMVVSEFKLPQQEDVEGSPAWGYINVQGDYLVGTTGGLIVDESKSVVGESSRPLQMWDVQARKLKWQPRGHTGQVHKMAFSADGKNIATASADKTAIVWDVETGKPLATFKGHQKAVRAVAFSPDGEIVATCSDDKTIKLWDAASGKELDTLVAHDDGVTGVAISPDGRWLASSSIDESAILWDLATRKVVATLAGHTDMVNDVVFSPDGQFLATSSEDKMVRLWDVATKKLKRIFQGHKDHVNVAAFSPDGKFMTTGSCDETVGLWEVSSGKMLAVLKGHGSIVNGVVFSPDGRLVFSGSRDQMVLGWDVAEKKQAEGFKAPGQVNCVAFSPDGRVFATGVEERSEPVSKENLSSSKQLVVMNRHTGKMLWQRQATSGFRHNAICLGGGRLYCIDRLPQSDLAKLKRRGGQPDQKPRVMALDLETGEEIWASDDGVFGTWLSYSTEHDVLVEAGRPGRDVLRDEARGIRVRRAATGELIWYNEVFSGPVMIHGSTLLKGQSACELLTGKPKLRVDPVTGQTVEWSWTRNYGCNTPIASQHLLTFRSGAAGYYDLARDGGTGNFGGFKSGCSNNLIVANGVLTAPDYTRTCTCSYQNQTSVGMVHMPEAEMWTEFPLVNSKEVHQIALNLGAPGHRRADDGKLWLKDHRSVKIQHGKFGFYCGHSSKVSGEGPNWVTASGCLSISEIEMDFGDANGDDSAAYTVRLYFADPDNTSSGKRVFDVKMQGETVLDDFDVAKEAGGRNRGVVKESKSVKIKDKLVLTFSGSVGGGVGAETVPILCGIDVERED